MWSGEQRLIFPATIECEHENINCMHEVAGMRYAHSFIPSSGRHIVASNPTLHTANGLSACIRPTLSRNCRFECASTTPRRAGIYLHRRYATRAWSLNVRSSFAREGMRGIGRTA